MVKININSELEASRLSDESIEKMKSNTTYLTIEEFVAKKEDFKGNYALGLTSSNGVYQALVNDADLKSWQTGYATAANKIYQKIKNAIDEVDASENFKDWMLSIMEKLSTEKKWNDYQRVNSIITEFETISKLSKKDFLNSKLERINLDEEIDDVNEYLKNFNSPVKENNIPTYAGVESGMFIENLELEFNEFMDNWKNYSEILNKLSENSMYKTAKENLVEFSEEHTQYFLKHINSNKGKAVFFVPKNLYQKRLVMGKPMDTVTSFELDTIIANEQYLKNTTFVFGAYDCVPLSPQDRADQRTVTAQEYMSVFE